MRASRGPNISAAVAGSRAPAKRPPPVPMVTAQPKEPSRRDAASKTSRAGGRGSSGASMERGTHNRNSPASMMRSTTGAVVRASRSARPASLATSGGHGVKGVEGVEVGGGGVHSGQGTGIVASGQKISRSLGENYCSILESPGVTRRGSDGTVTPCRRDLKLAAARLGITLEEYLEAHLTSAGRNIASSVCAWHCSIGVCEGQEPGRRTNASVSGPAETGTAERGLTLTPASATCRTQLCSYP